MSKEKIDVERDIARLAEIRSELFDMANSYGGDEHGNVAVVIHGLCNRILDITEYISAEFRLETEK